MFTIGKSPSLHVILCAGVLLTTPGTAAAALTLTRVASPSFGTVFSGASNRRLVLNTNGSVSGSNASDYISGAAAGAFTVLDTSSPATISILVDNVSVVGGLTVNSVLCSYNGGTQQSCDGSGMSTTSASSASLKIGLDITTSTAHSGGDTASVNMDVSIAYL